MYNDYRFAPDKIKIEREIMSSFLEMMPNFLDKGKYVLHYEYLQLYLRLGLKL